MRFRYVSKPLSKIYLRPESVSRGHNSKKQCLDITDRILTSLKYSKRRIELYYSVKRFQPISQKISSLISIGNFKNAKLLYKDYLKLLKENGLKQDFVINKASFKRSFLKNNFKAISSIINLIRK